jgi:hypothetical protein
MFARLPRAEDGMARAILSRVPRVLMLIAITGCSMPSSTSNVDALPPGCPSYAATILEPVEDEVLHGSLNIHVRWSEPDIPAHFEGVLETDNGVFLDPIGGVTEKLQADGTTIERFGMLAAGLNYALGVGWSCTPTGETDAIKIQLAAVHRFTSAP